MQCGGTDCCWTGFYPKEGAGMHPGGVLRKAKNGVSDPQKLRNRLGLFSLIIILVLILPAVHPRVHAKDFTNLREPMRTTENL